MKKIILLLLPVLYCNSKLSAQINYHFCTRPGIYQPTGDTWDQDPGDPGDWQRSHGNPNWGTSIINMWGMHRDQTPVNSGEGIYQDNVFPVKGNYSVRIGIREEPIHGSILVFSTLGLVPGGAGSIPVPPSMTLVGRRDYDPAHPLPTGVTSEWLIPDFYNPYDNAQFWIYPIQDSDRYFGQADLALDYVIVCRNLPGKLYPFGTLDAGTTYRDYFFIGSSLPFGSGVVKNDLTTYTEYIAKNHITILPNTEIKPGPNGAYFYGHIGSTDCGGETAELVCNIALPKIAQAGAGVSIDDVQLSPNPSNGNFKINLPDADVYMITVYNTIGGIVYKQSVSGNTSYEVSLTNAVPGNYILMINGGKINTTKRLTVLQ